jgi:hypothetical protein
MNTRKQSTCTVQLYKYSNTIVVICTTDLFFNTRLIMQAIAYVLLLSSICGPLWFIRTHSIKRPQTRLFAAAVAMAQIAHISSQHGTGILRGISTFTFQKTAKQGDTFFIVYTTGWDGDEFAIIRSNGLRKWEVVTPVKTSCKDLETWKAWAPGDYSF